ncbi:hypothetical protein D8I35_09405 [Corticibacter populi]|uniref:DUF6950 domain-containing protein n=2 Tax=Corticibacter populi TaxID=1550736 RepID=A0A3M6QUK2_9BURK|nr:hypothetical protein D8I35_09405 [Corticibacter populi]
MPARLPDWELRLAGLIAQRLPVPFSWGDNDCVLFAADCVAALHGGDPAGAWRGQWHDESTAIRALARQGGLQAAVQAHAAAMGWPEVPPLFAQRGDLVLHRRDGADALAVCTGPALAAPSEGGLLFFGLDHGVVAWRV